MPSEVHRKLLIDRAAKVVAEIDQIFADCEHWNRINPHDHSIDPDPDGALRDARSRAMRVVENLTEPTDAE